MRLLLRILHDLVYPPVNYRKYLKSDKWRTKARACKERAGWECEICHIPGNPYTLQAHHKVYTRLGHERPSDLQCLCDKCHKKVSGK